MVDFLSLYTNCKEKFAENGIENGENEVAILMEEIFHIKKFQFKYATKPPDEKLVGYFNECVERRINGEPLQYIIGKWGFYNLDFYVGKGVLIPRQDTETLVDCVINRGKLMVEPKIIDLCSGSGCIAITLEKELDGSKVTAVELHEEALFYLKKNKKYNFSNINISAGDVTKKDFVDTFEKFDIIVSNPPYLTSNDMKELQKEVGFEPATALYGGENGLYFYINIVEKWKPKLNKGGFFAFEIGEKQGDDVAKILKDNGLNKIFIKDDFCGKSRVVGGYL